MSSFFFFFVLCVLPLAVLIPRVCLVAAHCLQTPLLSVHSSSRLHLPGLPSFHITSSQAAWGSSDEPNSFLDCSVPCLFCLKDPSFLWLSWAALLPGHWASCPVPCPWKSVKTRQFVQTCFLPALTLQGRNSMNAFGISVPSCLAVNVRMHRTLEPVWHRLHEHCCGPVGMWCWGSLLGA